MPSRRTILGTLVAGAAALGAGVLALPFVRSMGLAPHKTPAYEDFDINALEPGETLHVTVYGTAFLVFRRTPEVIASLLKPNDQLRDSDSLESRQPAYAKNPLRSLDSEFFVAAAHCTHLGCGVERVDANDPRYYPRSDVGYFYCPCHASAFDLAGRVYTGLPAPENLVIPEYEFLENGLLRIYAHR